MCPPGRPLTHPSIYPCPASQPNQAEPFMPQTLAHGVPQACEVGPLSLVSSAYAEVSLGHCSVVIPGSTEQVPKQPANLASISRPQQARSTRSCDCYRLYPNIHLAPPRRAKQACTHSHPCTAPPPLHPPSKPTQLAAPSHLLHLFHY